MKGLHKLSFILLLVGGLNAGSMVVFNWSVDSLLGGPEATVSQALFVLIGLAAIYEILNHKGTCKACSAK